MAESASTPSAKQKSHVSNKWSAEQISALMDAVTELMPNNGAGWKEVCMRMHGINSRRRPCDYKAKYMSEKAKEQIITCQQNNKISNEIYFWYQQGKSCQEISDLLNTINSKTVEILLYRLFGILNKIIIKVVGSKRFREIKMKDHRLFGFMTEGGVKIQNLQQIELDCLCWRELSRPNSQFKKENPEKHKKMRNELEKKIFGFNELMKEWEERYTKSPSKLNQDGEKLKQVKAEEIRSQAISFMYLKAVSESPENFRQAEPFFSDETCSKMDSGLQYLKNTSCKTFDQQQLSNTHNTFLQFGNGQDQSNYEQKRAVDMFEEERFFSFNKTFH